MNQRDRPVPCESVPARLEHALNASPPGLCSAYSALLELVVYPVLFSSEYASLGLSRPRGVLLHGPPGVGKTHLVRTIAAQTRCRLTVVQGPEIVSPYPGETERTLRKIWKRARRNLKETGEGIQPADSPAGVEPLLLGRNILFIDEIDALAPKRAPSTPQYVARTVAQLLTLMDGLGKHSDTRGNAEFSGDDSDLVVIAATNRPNELDPALRRPGRFDREVRIPVPDEYARATILRTMLAKSTARWAGRDADARVIHGAVDRGGRTPAHTLSDLDFRELARATPGFVGADLEALVREALAHSGRAGNLAGPPTLGRGHFDETLRSGAVSASIRKGWTVDVGDVRWDDVGGNEEVKKKLRHLISHPLLHPETLLRLGLPPPRGVLLHGPPGCSKTMMARAAAGEAGVSFFSLDGAQVYSAYVGEAERIVRETFALARASAPSILFLDELDALAGSRSFSTSASSSSDSDPVRDRLLSTLLNELDGVDTPTPGPTATSEELAAALRSRVLVVGASNRPGAVDPALRRPGRLDRSVYVGPPDKAARIDILWKCTRGMNGVREEHVERVAGMTDGYSGADVSGVAREAGMGALRRACGDGIGLGPGVEDWDTGEVTWDDWDEAVKHVPGSLGPEVMKWYREGANGVDGT